MNRGERGAALLLVLWATILLAALLVGVAAASRSHGEAALYGSERVRAQLAAEAGLAQAIAGLRAAESREQWVPDGRPYDFEFDGAKVSVRVVDVSGMLDLNASPADLLEDLFRAAGVEAARAGQFANAVTAWRGDAQLAEARAPQAAAASGEPHGPFRAIDQLARLPGMDAALFARLAPAVTVFSGRNFPDASYAGPLALAALRGIDAQQAQTLVQGRRGRAALQGAGNGQAFGAVANGPLVAGFGGVVERVFSTAQLPDGTRAGLDVTVRLALTGTSARPYKVLDWRVDSTPTP